MVAVGRKHITSKEDLERLKAFYNEGWKYKDISDKMGLSKTWVAENCRKLIQKGELEDRKSKQKEIEFQAIVDTGKIFALWNAGWKIDDIAKDMYLNPKQVKQIIESEV